MKKVIVHRNVKAELDELNSKGYSSEEIIEVLQGERIGWKYNMREYEDFDTLLKAIACGYVAEDDPHTRVKQWYDAELESMYSAKMNKDDLTYRQSKLVVETIWELLSELKITIEGVNKEIPER